MAFCSFGFSIYETFLLSDGMAAFHGNDEQVQFYGELMWQVAGIFGSIVVISFDALMVRRNVKLAMALTWVANNLRAMYSIMFTYSAAPYMRPMDFCIAFECWSAEVVRFQVAFTIALYCMKYAISLLVWPESLIILKSSVSFEVCAAKNAVRVLPAASRTSTSMVSIVPGAGQ